MTLVLTGSINLTSGGITTDRDGVYSGSFSGSLVGDGSGLTGITGGGGGGSSDFPYTGSAIISGSLEVDGITEVISGSIIGDGSGLTDVQIFPFEGQADIIGGFKLDGEFEFNFASSSNGAWSAGGDMNFARTGLGGAGTQNAALAFGGYSNPSPYQRAYTEEYNGSSWSVGGDLNTARDELAGAGTQNAGLAFGGQCGGATPTCNVSCTEEYNGSSWSAGGSLLCARIRLAGAGTQNAGLAFGGNPVASCTEEYNGVSWEQGGALPTPKYNAGGAGIQNAALAFAGWTSPTVVLATSEKYNGTTWSTSENLATARMCPGGAGQQNIALAFGGSSPGFRSCTEEYNADACYRKHFYSQQNTVYSNQLYVTGSATADALLNLANRDTTPDPLTEGMIWQSGSANSGCLYFSPDGTSICKISFA